MRNALTIDVEDYFQVNAFARSVDRARWDSFPLRVAENTLRVLDLLDRFSLKATFFVLGWVARKRPNLVLRIAGRGHEIACHGFGHQLLHELGPERFRQDLRQARAAIEDACGRRVSGYRAPSWSVTGRSLWALDVLAEEGFAYDSSIFPILHDVYGMPAAPRFPYILERPAGDLVEFPPSTLELRLPGKALRLPVSGGGYLRLLPAGLVLAALRRINRRENQPAVLYFHPWEIDPGQPRIKAGFKSRFRHYLNLDKTERRLVALFNALDFGPMGEIIGSLKQLPRLAAGADVGGAADFA